jgi:arsenate reductase
MPGENSPALVIFACVHNAGRSQMAAALFNALVPATKARAVSAGTRPAGAVHPEVLAVMKEIGVDLSGARPQQLTDNMARNAHLLVTMGCDEECPYIPGLQREDWLLPDPKGQPLARVREIRDEIRQRVQKLIDQNWNR